MEFFGLHDDFENILRRLDIARIQRVYFPLCCLILCVWPDSSSPQQYEFTLEGMVWHEIAYHQSHPTKRSCHQAIFGLKDNPRASRANHHHPLHLV